MVYENGQLLTYQVDANHYGLCKVVNVTRKEEEEIINLSIYRFWSETMPKEEDLKELSPFIIHVPVAKTGVDQSNCSFIKKMEVTEEELKGYNNWLKPWQEGKTGFFPSTISAAVDYIFEEKSKAFNPTQSSNTSQVNMFRERVQKGGMDFPF